MSQDLFGAYQQAVDAVVSLVEAFPDEEDARIRFDRAGVEDGALLLLAVDEYSARAGEVFDALTARGFDDATYDRILALAAGDLRLAASLVAVDDPPADADDEEISNLRAELSGLRDDMNDVMAAVREKPEETDPGGGSPVPRPQLPNPSAPRGAVPPLWESSSTRPFDLMHDVLTRELDEPVGALARPVRGAAGGNSAAASVKSDIDKVLKKAAAEIGDLAVAGVTLGPWAVEEVNKLAAEEFNKFAVGQLGVWYQQLQDELSGIAKRAKRAAVKLLYEGIDKLLCLLRRALPPEVATAPHVRTALDQLATWLGKCAVEGMIQGGLGRLLQANDLKAHIDPTFKPLSQNERADRAFRASSRADRYHGRKFPIGVARVLIRVVRGFRLQHSSPPASEIVMACAVLGLCGISGWMAQDALDHPTPLRFVPDLQRGVRAEVDGN